MADTKIVVNCETGEVQVLELTAEELAERAATAAVYAKEQAAKEAEAAAVAAAKESAAAKLTALGLSADEIAALSK